MSRWTYLFPRITILLLISLAVWLGADPITRSVIIGGIEDRTGAKVEVGQLRCSLNDQKLFLKDLMIADPDDSMRNVAQADVTYLEFDRNELAHRRIVITGGQTSRLMFGTPRTTSGRGSAAPSVQSTDVSPETPAGHISSTKITVEQRGRNWLDQLLPPKNQSLNLAEMQLTQTAQRIDRNWTNELLNLGKTISKINDSAADLDQLATKDHNEDNPLRRRWQRNEFIHLKSISSEHLSVAKRIQVLQQQLAKDVELLDTAEKVDADAAAASVTAIEFNSDHVSDLLLSDLHDKYVDQSVQLFQWFQQATPNFETAFKPRSQRGVDIPLPGQRRRPSFLIEKLELNGEGRFMDQQFNFAGFAHDLSTEPKLHDKPAKFDLRAQGKQHVALTCTIDRRGDQPIDQIEIACPNLDSSEKVLGEPNSLQVTMGDAGRVQANVKLKTIGDQIAGTILLKHSNVSFHVDALNELAGGKMAALQMNQGVTAIKNFQSTINVSGTVSEPQINATSDLGTQFAGAVNRALQEKKDQVIAANRKSISQLRQSIEARLLNDYAKQLEQLQAALKESQVRIADLQSTAETNTERSGLKRF
jgi:uncharacterized protein (TIGR03545 family)